MAPTPTAEVPIIVRGEGAYVWDEHGNRYLDGLSALFCVNAGHGRAELGEAAARQVEELDFFTIWSYAHPRAIELATRIASLAPGRPEPRLLHLRRLGGGGVGDQAGPRLPPADGQPAQDQVHQPRDRLPRHDAGGARRDRDLGAARTSSSRWCRAAARCRTPTATTGRRTGTRCGRPSRSRRRILFEHPDTVAAVILEPLQNAGGCIPPQEGYFQRVREICDRHDVLLISDEVICAWGRLGHWFGCERYGYCRTSSPSPRR